VRITPVSWLIVLAGAVAFGGGIVGLARVLPTDPPLDEPPPRRCAPPAELRAPTQPTGATRTITAVGLPPAARSKRHEPIDALDFHPVDPPCPTARHPTKRPATESELLAIAATYDIVVDDLRWQPDGAEISAEQIAAMKAANPRLRVLRYIGVLTNNDGPIFNIAPTEDDHGTSFLRDSGGDFVRAYSEIAPWNGKPSYTFDLTSIDVRNNVSAWARQFGRWLDGIFLDGISPCVPAPVPTQSSIPAQRSCPATLLSAPLDKTTNRPYTDAAWREATIGLLTAIRHTAPNTQIFIAATPEDLSSFAPHIDGTVRLHQP
jgi:hypothetical protein